MYRLVKWNVALSMSNLPDFIFNNGRTQLLYCTSSPTDGIKYFEKHKNKKDRKTSHYRWKNKEDETERQREAEKEGCEEKEEKNSLENKAA